MAFEDDDRLERAYPYRVGWKAMGCTALVLAAVGAAGLMFLPFGCDQVQNGDPVVGWVVIVGGLCTTPFLLLALAAAGIAGRDLVSPPLLRVTPTALRLPADARGPAAAAPTAAADEYGGDPPPEPPRAHPAEIPFARIRWARRETSGSAGNDRLLVVHDLGSVTLELLQNMMRPADFDELDAILRAAVPEAFAALPPPPEPEAEDE